MRVSIILGALFGVLANCCPNAEAQRQNSTYPIAPGARENQSATQTPGASSQTSGVAAQPSSTYDGGASTGSIPVAVAGILALMAIGIA